MWRAVLFHWLLCLKLAKYCVLLQMVMVNVTPVDDFPTKKRGGKGVIAIKTSERNGELVGAVAIDESERVDVDF